MCSLSYFIDRRGLRAEGALVGPEHRREIAALGHRRYTIQYLWICSYISDPFGTWRLLNRLKARSRESIEGTFRESIQVRELKARSR